jgi:thiamine-phosphate pyrophosphorylase
VPDWDAMTPRARLADARLYLVCDTEPGGRALEPFLRACLRGGVDLIQLRAKDASDPELLAAGRTFRTLADEYGALFILNDRPDLVDAASADGVHLGQDDDAPAAARAVIGPDRVIGRSTHAPAQADAAERDPDVDYLAVGPLHATPTKPGRPAAGPGYVAYAAEHVRKPWFAIGGLDAVTLPAAVALGARRIVVVRALTGAAEPEPAARALRDQLEVPVGPAGR